MDENAFRALTAAGINPTDVDVVDVEDLDFDELFDDIEAATGHKLGRVPRTAIQAVVGVAAAVALSKGVELSPDVQTGIAGVLAVVVAGVMNR